MLKKCRTVLPGSTLITGSSHALNGIQESAWNSAVNCSMHSQDLYYDFLCAKRAILSAGTGRSFQRCFIVMGYYIAYQDLSLSTVSRNSIITSTYYPIFRDAHNWQTPTEYDLWSGFGRVPEPVKQICQQIAEERILEAGTYYSALHKRVPLYNFGGRTWAQLTPEERLTYGKSRAADHNKIYQHKASFIENKEILREFVRFLYDHDTLPIVVVAPFTAEYNQFVLPEMKSGVLELLDSVPDDVHYVDFNECDLFEDADFMDTDHLSAQGAAKVSHILVTMFGA